LHLTLTLTSFFMQFGHAAKGGEASSGGHKVVFGRVRARGRVHFVLGARHQCSFHCMHLISVLNAPVTPTILHICIVPGMFCQSRSVARTTAFQVVGKACVEMCEHQQANPALVVPPYPLPFP
ncbi:unnamed protein product, partial [Discosporangium mesarthrocarpum]